MTTNPAQPPITTEARPRGVVRSAPTIIFLAIVAVLVLSQFYAALVFGPAAAAEFASGAGAAALTQLAFGVPYAVAFIGWGPLVDRFGAARMLLLGLALVSTATACTAFAPGMGWLLAGRMLQGIAAASFAPAAFAYVGVRLPQAVRVTAITVLTSSFLAAAVLGQVAAQVVVDALSWRWFFGVSAVLLGACLMLGSRVLRPAEAAPVAQVPPLRAFGSLLRSGRIVLLLIATLAILGPFTAMYAALGQAGMAFGSSGALLTLRLSALPALLWAGFAAPWLGRFQAGARLTIGLVAAVAAAVALSFLAEYPLGVGIGMFVFAAGVALAAPAMIQQLSEFAPSQRGSVTALFTCMLFLGASLAPTIVTSFSTVVPAADPVTATAIGGAAMLLLAVACAAIARRPGNGPPARSGRIPAAGKPTPGKDPLSC